MMIGLTGTTSLIMAFRRRAGEQALQPPADGRSLRADQFVHPVDEQQCSPGAQLPVHPTWRQQVHQRVGNPYQHRISTLWLTWENTTNRGLSNRPTTIRDGSGLVRSAPGARGPAVHRVGCVGGKQAPRTESRQISPPARRSWFHYTSHSAPYREAFLPRDGDALSCRYRGRSSSVLIGPNTELRLLGT